MGWPGWGGREGKPCLHPACTLPALPPSQPVQKSLLCCWVFSPLLIPNQEIKGRQRLQLFPLCRELESSGRGDHPFPDRLRGGGRTAQVEGPGWGDTLGAAVGGPGGNPGVKALRVLGEDPARVAQGLGAQNSSGRVGGSQQQREEEEGWG